MEPIKYNVTDAALGKLKKKFAKVPDCKTKEGYEIARAGIAELRTLRGGVESHRKDLKKESLDYGRMVDSEAKRIIGAIIELEEPMQQAKKVIDDIKEAEKEAKKKTEADRIFALKSKVEAIRISPLDYVNANADDLAAESVDVGKLEITEEVYGEFVMEAELAKVEALEKLGEMYNESILREKADRERKEAEKKLAEEKAAFEKEQKEAEEERAAAQKIEDDRIAAEREKLQKEKDEHEATLRAEKEERQAAEEEAAETKRKEDEEAERKKKDKADDKLKAQRRQETIDDLDRVVNPMDQLKNSVAIYNAIEAGKIAHVGLV